MSNYPYGYDATGRPLYVGPQLPPYGVANQPGPLPGLRSELHTNSWPPSLSRVEDTPGFSGGKEWCVTAVSKSDEGGSGSDLLKRSQ